MQITISHYFWPPLYVEDQDGLHTERAKYAGYVPPSGVQTGVQARSEEEMKTKQNETDREKKRKGEMKENERKERKRERETKRREGNETEKEKEKEMRKGNLRHSGQHNNKEWIMRGTCHRVPPASYGLQAKPMEENERK
ncbi:hypothetical protein FIBSPDRAFT_881459 [Athelia psychrophila]|uniref:Uncharacterized protein n=1 Tax=Athelia psychrophila TaxID=1759441 RepID=A0A166WQ69_9AGAM|nr:hypothetical protein FIBSPDRAFT_881459 [Fibularhizoctonia sp. CBS 109695]